VSCDFDAGYSGRRNFKENATVYLPHSLHFVLQAHEGKKSGKGNQRNIEHPVIISNKFLLASIY